MGGGGGAGQFKIQYAPLRLNPKHTQGRQRRCSDGTDCVPGPCAAQASPEHLSLDSPLKRACIAQNNTETTQRHAHTRTHTDGGPGVEASEAGEGPQSAAEHRRAGPAQPVRPAARKVGGGQCVCVCARARACACASKFSFNMHRFSILT